MQTTIEKLAKREKMNANRMPNKTTTDSGARAISAWRELARPFEERLGWFRLAHDPYRSRLRFMGERGTVREIDLELALDYYALATGRKFDGRAANGVRGGAGVGVEEGAGPAIREGVT